MPTHATLTDGVVPFSQLPAQLENEFKGAMVKLSGNLTGVNYSAGEGTAIPFDAEIYDTLGFHSTTVNNSRLTVPSGYGITKVRLAGGTRFENVTATTNYGLWIYKGGSATLGCGMMTGGDEVFTNPRKFVSTGVVEVAEGDYFELYAYAADTSVDLLATVTWFSIEVVEATHLLQHQSRFSSVSSSAGVLALDLSSTEYFKTALTENVTSVTMSGLGTGVVNRFELRVTQGAGNYTFANPTSWKFPGGTAYTPSATNADVDILRGRTYDNGTTWEVEFSKDYS